MRNTKDRRRFYIRALSDGEINNIQVTAILSSSVFRITYI